MSASFAVLALLGLGAGVTPTPPSAPMTTRYRIESKNHTTIDLSAFGQPSQEIDAGITAWVVLTLSDTTGGKVIHMVVDSTKLVGTAPIGQESADSAKGGTIHGLLDSNGRVKNLVSTPGLNVLVLEIQNVVNGMFPKIKSGVQPGQIWSDTSEVSNTSGGANTKTVFRISYTAGERETVAGQPGLKVSASSTSNVSGTVQNPNMGSMEVEGTGIGTAAFTVGADGRFLGGTLTSTVDQKVKPAMAPAPIPIKSVRTVTVTLLP